MTNLQKISILCAAVLTMGLTACGETAENTDSKESTTAATTTAAAETTTTTTAATADDSAEDVESEVETESAVEEETESEAEEIDKKILKEQIRYYDSPNDNLISRITKYDEHGNITSDVTYFKQAKIDEDASITDIYNENTDTTVHTQSLGSKLDERIATSFEEQGEDKIIENEYEYDEDGKIIKWNNFYPVPEYRYNDFSYFEMSPYDIDGKLFLYNPAYYSLEYSDNKLMNCSSDIYSYQFIYENDVLKRTEKTSSSLEGVVEINDYVYNDSNIIVKEIVSYTKDGVSLDSIEPEERNLTLDSVLKNILKKQGIKFESSDALDSNEYDKNGNIIKTISYDNNNYIDKMITYEFDENGNVTLEKDYTYDTSKKLEKASKSEEINENSYIITEYKYENTYYD